MTVKAKRRAPAAGAIVTTEAVQRLRSAESIDPKLIDGGLPDELCDDTVRIRRAAAVFVSVATTLADPFGEDWDSEVVAALIEAYCRLDGLGVPFADSFRRYMERTIVRMRMAGVDCDDDRDGEVGRCETLMPDELEERARPSRAALRRRSRVEWMLAEFGGGKL